MITPGDITDELIERANGEIRANCGPNPPTDHERVAAILNAAIKAGLVSPPVYAVRDDKGNLERGFNGVPIVCVKPHVLWNCEHWRGQEK